MAKNPLLRFNRRKQRVRTKIRSLVHSKLRLSVFMSNQHVYAQIINDQESRTLVSASTIDKAMKSGFTKTSNIDAAAEVGKALAQRAKDAGIETVVFDRGGKKYHGKVKALADAAREAGLNF
ncbi:MAG: 50S ribosomal protein L18 [Alphaproteobacteria bacterium]|nr:50S ribosomal protein L18 [Alphaproteobacteria bacterium]OJV16371.1 MAG: 50S ribosomal protein L18 [Alphaproteobacteria bacterium 33-17]